MLQNPWRFVVLLVAMLFAVSAAALAATSSTGNTTSNAPWPHHFTVDGTPVTFYQPQLDSWSGDTLSGRLAISVKKGTATNKDGKKQDILAYGVGWFTARTETDKQARTVTLRSVTLDKVNFPTDTTNQGHYLALARKALPQKPFVASLDQLEATLAINHADAAQASQAVNNDPPQIIFSFEPALLVLVDGSPAVKPTSANGVSRVINTRSLLLIDDGTWYLRFAGKWMKAPALPGPWSQANGVPSGLDKAMQEAVAAKQVDVMDKPSDEMKKALAAGKYPAIYTATGPTELIMVDGEPQFAPLAGTDLAYVVNTAGDVFVDAHADNTWYVLLSGRWFSAASTKGPWTYVPGDKLPADFAKIPSDSPKSAVLASIPGTPEARESLIANSIPQTATVQVKQASLSVHYDGNQPQFKPIDGTVLNYAWNTATPVIQVTPTQYYAVQNGVWFSAAAPVGPWAVATLVPPVIYSIPANSPLHYVTYVHVYGHTDTVVYVGYTPGYYGTVVTNGVVVYGTGYACNAWVGDVWYACPATYGYNVAFGYDAYAGWTFGFVAGWAWASAWYGPYWGPWYGWYGPYPWYWGPSVAVGNVYGRWGNTVAQGVRADWYNPWTGNSGTGVRGSFYNEATGGHGYGYAARNYNQYTGVTSGAAGGVRYNPETGRAVAGQGGAAYNSNTGNAIAGGHNASVNTNTGRATTSAGVATRTDQGATAAGGFNSKGAGGDVSGKGYVHYDASTGQVTHGGVVNSGGNVYAGKDGNVYRYEQGQGWQQVQPDGQFKNVAKPPAESGVTTDQLARQRGTERTIDRSGATPGAQSGNLSGATRQNVQGAGERTPNQNAGRAQNFRSFDRGSYGGGFQGHMGGFRRFR
ncbi:hypothetical protein [Silvimonas amylolytica]|uniref:Carbohydrate-binding family V/XII n=1 Tax=Silvimonas amylolytica TaxID=449663 RepID=A0ABQ2PHB4_9NEIS|nr:hypothetical protein [Silvimonas amylolytica]GGP24743.1 hypothetical protein GCM10010971_05620 [Silvimonas amylolytica]